MKQVTKGHKPTQNQETSKSDILRLNGFIERIQSSNQTEGLYIRAQYKMHQNVEIDERAVQGIGISFGVNKSDWWIMNQWYYNIKLSSKVRCMAYQLSASSCLVNKFILR